MTRALVPASIVLACLAFGSPVRAWDPVVYNDGEFLEAEWQYFQIAAGGGGTATFYSEPQVYPGNPGRMVFTNTQVNANCSAIYGFGIKPAAAFDPSEEGAIGFIEYYEDAIALASFGDGQALGPALRQGGNMYIWVGLATGTVETWHLVGNTRLTENDFVHVTGGGCPGYVNESAHPDFSKDGGNIEFGFYRANSQIPGQIDYSVGGGIDNWHVAIHPFDYVAMGDSFSSGEGLSPYIDGTNTESPLNTCHRSTQAYGFQLDFADLDEGAFLACSGAVTYNVYREPQGTRYTQAPEEPTQLDRKFPPPDEATYVVNEGTDMITLSFGGNDLGFAQILEFCATNACDSDTYRPFQILGFNGSLKQWVEARLPHVASNLALAYSSIKEKAPNAAIFVLGYPKLFGGNCPGPLYSAEEGVWLDTVAQQLNRRIYCEAKAAGIHVIQVSPVFEGHGACSPAPWLHDLDFGWPVISDFIQSRSFHPTPEGQRQYAATLNTYMKDLVTQGAPLTAGRVPANPAPSVPANCPASFVAPLGASTPSLDALIARPETAPPCDGRGRYIPGQQVRVSGSRFAANAVVMLRLESGAYVSSFATANADGAGTLDAVVTLPAGAPTNVAALLTARGTGALSEPRLLVTNIGLSTSFAADADGDAVPDPCDLCPGLNVPGTADADGDGLGDACDPCPADVDNDIDGDTYCANVDLCPWDAANDADGDGDCESSDNCPIVSNADQRDTDDDGVGNDCDALPSDPGVFAAPVEVTGLGFDGDGQTLTWTSAIRASGALTLHDVARGAIGAFPPAKTDVCLLPGSSVDTFTDTQNPAPGQGFWYLARSRNVLGVGSWGTQAGGAERSVFVCPFE